MEKYQCYDYGHDAQYDNDGHDNDDDDDDYDDYDDDDGWVVLASSLGLDDHDDDYDHYHGCAVLAKQFRNF